MTESQSTRSLAERLAGPGEQARRQLKGRATADLLDFADVARVVAHAIAPGKPVTRQVVEKGEFVCTCNTSGSALPCEELVWFEEWGWARERTRGMVFAECALCGAIHWAPLASS